MTVDRRGRTFLSYRRTRAADMGRLVPVLHEMGVPTWQDVSNLEEHQTEEALRATIARGDIGGGLLWLTPDVEGSAMMRDVEIPGLVGRAGGDRAFPLVVVLAGGLTYGDVGRVVGFDRMVDDLGTWNLKRLPARGTGGGTSGEASVEEVQSVASLVLRRRLAAVLGDRLPDHPVRALLIARGSAPACVEHDLVVHWDHHFQGRHAKPVAWEVHLLPALSTLRSAIQEISPGRSVEFEGLIPLGGALALGHAFLQPLGLRTSWRQSLPSGEVQSWSLSAAPERVTLVSRLVPRTLGASDLAVLVSVGGAVETAFNSSQQALPPLRGVVMVDVAGASLPLASAGAAVYLANEIVRLVKEAQTSLRAQGTIHLFIAGPAGLAFLVGQLSNQLTPVQTYEYDRESAPPYRPAALVRAHSPISPLAGGG